MSRDITLCMCFYDLYFILLTLFSELSSVDGRTLSRNPKNSHVSLFQWSKAILNNGLMYLKLGRKLDIHIQSYSFTFYWPQYYDAIGSK